MGQGDQGIGSEGGLMKAESGERGAESGERRAVEKPVATPASDAVWGSDVVASVLRALDIPYIALNPGASYRGLHDSIVNYLGNRAPQMILCLHDETAVSIAQGYFKASDRMMASALHS